MPTQISGTTGVDKHQDGSVTQADLAADALIETGSNANGTYIKFPDGTMLCTMYFSVPSLALSTIGLGGYRNAGTSAPATFPHEFSAAPAISVTPVADDGIGCSYTTLTTAGANIIWTAATTQAAASRRCQIIAIGRWK